MTDSDSLDTRKQLGLLFQQAREAQNLAISDISAELKLLASSVRGLENADYRAIKGNVFVKGYIKAYAQFLQLDQDECLRLYAEGELPESEVASTPSSDNVLTPLPAIKIAVGVVVVAVIIICYQLFGGSANNDSGDKTLGAVTSNTTEVAKVLIDVVTTSQLELEFDAPAVEAIGPNEVLDESTKTSVNDVVINAVDLTSADPVTTGDDLSLSFSDDCWVEVADATGKRLLSDLKRAGEKIVLNGEPPFDVLFGYGPAVEITYLGEPVKFTVGENPTVKLSIGEKR